MDAFRPLVFTDPVPLSLSHGGSGTLNIYASCWLAAGNAKCCNHFLKWFS